eukprot:1162094-Pelagomonas_calceolata.AAC.3
MTQPLSHACRMPTGIRHLQWASSTRFRAPHQHQHQQALGIGIRHPLASAAASGTCGEYQALGIAAALDVGIRHLREYQALGIAAALDVGIRYLLWALGTGCSSSIGPQTLGISSHSIGKEAMGLAPHPLFSMSCVHHTLKDSTLTGNFACTTEAQQAMQGPKV